MRTVKRKKKNSGWLSHHISQSEDGGLSAGATLKRKKKGNSPAS